MAWVHDEIVSRYNEDVLAQAEQERERIIKDMHIVFNTYGAGHHLEKWIAGLSPSARNVAQEYLRWWSGRR